MTATTEFHRPIRKIVIHTDDGERTVTWSGVPCDPANLVEDIEDVLHWAPGASSLFQNAGPKS